MKKKFEEHKNILYTVLILLLILFFVYLIKGLFPFGKNLILQGDLYQQNTPFLYNFYDIVTGEKNLFYNLSISAGSNNFYEGIVELVNPINYILFLLGRDNIYKSVNILFALYILLAGITSNFTLNKLFKDKKKLNMFLSIMYAASSYSLFMYQIIRWLYLPVLFPLYILTLKRLLENEKGTLYSLMITYIIILGVQNAFSLILFTLISSFIYIFKDIPKELRKRKILILGLYTLMGILLSSVVLFPNINTILTSARSRFSGTYLSIARGEIIHNLDIYDRIYIIFNPLAIAILIYNIFKKNKKGIKTITIILVLMLLSAIYAPSNFLWHLGSYMCFPVRYGYIISFISIIYILNNLNDDEKKQKDISARDIILSSIIFIILFIIVVLLILYSKKISEGFSTLYISLRSPKSAFYLTIIILLLLISSLLIVMNKNNKIRNILLYILVIINAFSNILCGLLCNSYFNVEYENLTQMSHYNNNTDFIRTKNDNIYNRNGAMINKVNTLSGYLPSGSRLYYDSHNDWGYYGNWVLNGDTGGTILSDELLRVGYYYEYSYKESTIKKLNFKEINRVSNISLYKNNDIFPLGVLIDNNYKSLEYLNTPLEFQSELSRTLFDEEIINIIQPICINDNYKEIIYYIKVDEPKIIYIESPYFVKYFVSVNGVLLDTESYRGGTEATTIIDLGYYENEEIELKVIQSSEEILDEFQTKVATLDVNKLAKVVSNYKEDLVKINKNKITGEVEVEDDKMLFIQIPNISGWSLLVNGKPKEIKTVLKGYIGVPLTKGYNKIELTYYPKYIKLGLILTLLSVLSLIIINLLQYKLVRLNVLKNASYIIFILTFIISIMLLYIVPIICSVLKLIE